MSNPYRTAAGKPDEPKVFRVIECLTRNPSAVAYMVERQDGAVWIPIQMGKFNKAETAINVARALMQVDRVQREGPRVMWSSEDGLLVDLPG